MSFFKSKFFKTNQSVVVGAAWITIFTFGSKFLGFIRQMLVGAFFGTSKGFDAIIIAQQPAYFISGIVASSFSMVAIPLYLDEKLKNGNDGAKKFARGLLTFISIFLLGFGLFLFLMPDLFIKIFAPGFPKSTLFLASKYLRFFAILPVFSGLSNIFGAFLKAERMFFQYSLATFTFNIVLIPILWIFTPKIGIVSYPIAWISGTASVAFFSYLFGRNIWSFFPFGNPFTQKVLKSFYLATPLFLSITISTINGIVDKAFASSLPVGSVSSLSYAFSIVNMLQGLITSGILTSSFTSVSESASLMDEDSLTKKTRKLIEIILKLLSPIVIFLILESNWIVSIIYQRGNFTINSTIMTSAALTGYSIMILTVPINGALTNVYMAKKKTLRLTLLSVPFIFLNALMDWWLMKPFQQAGIAASSSIVGLLWMLILTLDLKYHYKISHLFTLKILPVVLFSIFYLLIFLFPLSHIPSLPKLILEIATTIFLVLFFARNELKMILKIVIRRKKKES